MDKYDDTMAPRFRELLEGRGQQLRSMLREPGEAGVGTTGEVVDFKDLATHESQAAVDEVQAEHASRELQQVLAALARLGSHGYGLCERCGDAIDLHRLEALPATPLCIACQILQEHGRVGAARR